MARRPQSTIPKYKRQRHRSHIGSVIWNLIRVLLGLVVLSLLWVLAYRFINPPVTATMLGDVFAGRGAKRDWMPIGQIDRDMVRAAIAAEDSKFCSHDGFDVEAIENAMKRNASGGRIRGGSTISQQTAKNAFLWQGGGYVRKGLEAWFTLLIESIWGKPRIMEVYLNLAETGIGTYGVNAGSQRYYRHDASAMSALEAARMAAVLPLPKARGALAPKGFTRRYGNTIAARVGVVARDGLDTCVYRDAIAPLNRAAPSSPKPRSVPGEEYESVRPSVPPADLVDDLPVATDAPVIFVQPSTAEPILPEVPSMPDSAVAPSRDAGAEESPPIDESQLNSL